MQKGICIVKMLCPCQNTSMDINPKPKMNSWHLNACILRMEKKKKIYIYIFEVHVILNRGLRVSLLDREIQDPGW